MHPCCAAVAPFAMLSKWYCVLQCLPASHYPCCLRLCNSVYCSSLYFPLPFPVTAYGMWPFALCTVNTNSSRPNQSRRLRGSKLLPLARQGIRKHLRLLYPDGVQTSSCSLLTILIKTNIIYLLDMF